MSVEAITLPDWKPSRVGGRRNAMDMDKVHKRTLKIVELGPSTCGCIRLEKKGEAGHAFACQKCENAYAKEYWQEYARQLSIS
jgi:hypothetical protein